jgi:hypothetical protein
MISSRGALRKKLAAASLLAAMATGCAHDVPTSPDTFRVEPANAGHLRGPQLVALRNGYQTEAKKAFSVGMGHTWTADQKQVTDTALTMLARALEHPGIRTADPAPKSITLAVRVDHAFLHSGAFVSHANVRLVIDAAFGDGSNASVFADNNSPIGASRAFEGALMRALNRLLIDERFVAYLNRTGADPVKPGASAPLPVVAAVSAPVVAAATAPPASAQTSRFPQVGDTWTYDLIRRGANVRSAPRMYVVKVVYSSEAKISDQVSLGGGRPEESDHTAGRYLVTQVVSILSPYLGVFENPAHGPMGEIKTSADRSCGGRERCEVTGRVAGREIVRVPAGEFESIKVTVHQAWRNPSAFQGGTSDARRELTGWYAPKAKRFVKFSSRTKMGSTPDFDLELTSYQLK